MICCQAALSYGCMFAKTHFQSLSYFLVNPKIQTAFSRDVFVVLSFTSLLKHKHIPHKFGGYILHIVLGANFCPSSCPSVGWVYTHHTPTHTFLVFLFCFILVFGNLYFLPLHSSWKIKSWPEELWELLFINKSYLLKAGPFRRVRANKRNLIISLILYLAPTYPRFCVCVCVLTESES